MDKIVIIEKEALTRYTKQIYYIEAYQNAGFEVEYWNLRPFLYPQRILTDELNEPFCYLIDSFQDFSERLDTVDTDHTVFISLVSEIWRHRELFRILSDKKCMVVTIDYHANANIKLTPFRRFLRIFRSNIWKKTLLQLDKIRYSRYKKKYNILDFARYYSTSFYGTDRINHPDYESYVMLKNEKDPIIPEKYIVFIDNYYPLHPDFRDFKISKPVDAKAYQKSMRLFFDYLEEKYQIPVIIAAHPKAIYQNNEFGDRKIVKYATGKLIQHSELVLLHSSNSLSYAVLFNKPIAFIKTVGMKSMDKFTFYIHSLAGILGKEVFDIDKNDFKDFNFSEIKTLYKEQYIYSYLTSPQTKNKLNWEILIHDFKELLKNPDRNDRK